LIDNTGILKTKINEDWWGMEMFNEEDLNEDITISFSLLKVYIEYKNKKRRHTDANRIVEGYLAKLFNKCLNTNFVVCDLLLSEDGTYLNQPAVDLIEDRKKIAIQVTSDNTITKIKHTINQFNKEELFKKYNDLYVLIINYKKKYREIKKLKADCKRNGYTLHVFDVYDLIDFFILADSDIKIKVYEFNKKYLKASLSEIIIEDSDNDYTLWDKAETFAEHLKDSSDDYIVNSVLEDYLKELEYFVIKLSGIPHSTRKVLFKIIKNNISYEVDSGVVFDGIKVQKKSGLTFNDFRNEIIILTNEGFDIYDYEDANRYRISYDITSHRYDILSELLTFCDDYQISLKKLIIDLEFDLLN